MDERGWYDEKGMKKHYVTFSVVILIAQSDYFKVVSGSLISALLNSRCFGGIELSLYEWGGGNSEGMKTPANC